MSEKHMTRPERREASDRRIIASAIRCYGRYGYTHSRNVDVARGAGVTAGLVGQRFEGKEQLFILAYRTALAGVFRELPSTATPRECLCSIIEDIVRLYDADPDVFEFCVMLHNTTDYPREGLRELQAEQKKANAYAILGAAQQSGMLPSGNLDELLASFGAMVFNQVKLCRRYHLELPEHKVFLEAIHFVDSEVERDRNWHRILETAIANTFEILAYIDLRRNTAELLKSAESFSLLWDSKDIRSDIEQTLQRYISEQDREMVRAHFDPDTLSDRLRGRKSLSLRFRNLRGNECVHSYIPLTWDEDGSLAEVFAGIYELKRD